MALLQTTRKAPILERQANDTLLSVRDLETHFFTKGGVVNAVNGVSFDLARGERMAIVGESGSGKSVMAMSILGLVSYPGRIVGGDVQLNGRSLIGLPAHEMNDIRGKEAAMVFQDPMTSLNPVIRVEEQIIPPMRRHLGISHDEARQRALELLRQVGIPDEERRLRAYPHELSGGMRQRVLIAIALSCKPDLILADEPTTALDVTIQAQIVSLLRHLADKTGAAVLFVTHDLGLVARFAQKVAVMYAGRFVEYGPIGRGVREPAASLHERPAQLDPVDYGSEGRAPDADRRVAAGHAPSAAGLRLHAALPGRDRCLRDEPAGTDSAQARSHGGLLGHRNRSER